MIQTQKIIRKYVNDGKDEEELKFDDVSLKKCHSTVSCDDFGNQITICAKDIILQPFTLTLQSLIDNQDSTNQLMIEEEKHSK